MKKAKLAMAIVTVFVLAAELCFGVFASSSASYNITGTITYKVENNITANTSVTSLSASRTCSHQDATGNVSASTGVNISDYFTVVLNGSTLTNDEIKSNVSSGTLSVSPATGLTYDNSTGKVYMTPSQITSTNGANVSNSYTLTLTLDSNTTASVSIPTTTTVGSWSSTSSGNYAATCEATGWKDKTVCSQCSDIITAGSSIAALGHSWNSGTVTTAAGCESTGIRTYTCSTCKETKKETISATGHSWNSGEVTKSATCSTSGVRTYTCTTCGGTETETIAATGNHSYGYWRKTSAATCTSAEKGYYECLTCTKHLSTTTKGSALGHDYSVLKSSGTDATCCSTGTYATYKCSRCSSTDGGGTIPKDSSNHSGGTTTKNESSASCTSSGYTGDTYCGGCGSKLSSGSTISALGHNKGSLALTTYATCTTNGYNTYKCTRCGASIQELYQSATGHSYTITGYWCKTCYASCTVGTRGAICGTHGYVSVYTKKCSSCGVYA